ncbi:MAG TPA: DNA polymerase Y family protein [Polaromonas sp.]|uniref:Y-family DNA polymerase n=1 Tax=Polaromonas sp. TaxID=1869339 RepID=UPI002D5BDE9B|nr:DNA polymerase Y family protein [Polaromonas sp.]HYW57237.1 DNA polymerase Y family protein [Polaromonas sp.]
MRWIALLPPTAPELLPAEARELQELLAWHALRFSPRVCLQDEAVLVEVSGSTRLFGGLGKLAKQLSSFVYEQNSPPSLIPRAQGATSLIAIGRLRASLTAPGGLRLPADVLPLGTLTAARAHLGVLERVGCRTWGDLRRLPRAGVARRFGQPLLDALDQAYGEQPESHRWLSLPEVFEAKLELHALVENAGALLFAAQRLLARLQAWLVARGSGLLALRLVWHLDPRRNGPTTGELVVRTAEASQDMAHASRLIAEHLAHATLPSPAHSLSLHSLEVAPLVSSSHSLLIQEHKRGDSLAQLTERLSARLGPRQVLRWQARATHVPERMQRWIAAQGSRSVGTSKQPLQQFSQLQPDALLPSWLLATPLKLAVRQDRPLCPGPLNLLAGPQRLETSGWAACGLALAEPLGEQAAMRDYFIAVNEEACLLWIYRERLARASGWYLHGVFV